MYSKYFPQHRNTIVEQWKFLCLYASSAVADHRARMEKITVHFQVIPRYPQRDRLPPRMFIQCRQVNIFQPDKEQHDDPEPDVK